MRRHQDWKEPQGLVLDGRVHAQDLGVADEFVHRSEAELGQQSSNLLGNEGQIVDDMLRQPLEFLPELRVLRRDPHWARVEVALAHHDTAYGDERRSGEAKALGTEEGRNDNVTACSQLPVRLQRHTTAEAVEHEGLVRFCESKLPGSTRMLDASPLRGPGATIAATDQDMVSLALGHTSGDHSDADLADEFHANVCGRVSVLEVEDQLRQVLDGVDVVVRRRRNKSNARRGATRLGDVFKHFLARQLTALAWLGSLSHLDLQLNRISKVLDGDPKASRCHLLDGRLHGIAVFHRLVPARVLAALAGVGQAADAIHSHC
mmetsp:Transcript_51253/g.111214  ORF Transcript_51253/g.111214 Transcript_51253/m.111214 type:complete len:319 (+) Transcript_51253:2624-3580(+)